VTRPLGAGVAGQVAFAKSGELIGKGDLGKQAEQCFANIRDTLVALFPSQAATFDGLLDPKRDVVLTVPDAHPLLLPVLMVVPLQLLAYHVAIARGADVDQPRNLAKSVTVE